MNYNRNNNDTNVYGGLGFLERASMVSTSITIDSSLLRRIAETLRKYHSSVDNAFERFDNDYRELKNRSEK